MLSNVQSVVNVNANSIVTVGDKPVVAAYFGASVRTDADTSFSQVIRDREAYLANMDAVDADYAEFKKSVLQSVSV